MAESENADWRQLCAAAAREQDAAKLTTLVNQLIRALDETAARSNASDARRDASHAPISDGSFRSNL